MTVLAIDTSSRRRVVCVVTSPDGEVLRQHQVRDTHVDEGLPPLLELLVDGEIGAVVVVTGPGSYTGVRSGMAAGLGMAQARGLPLHGVGTLLVVAAGSELPGRFWAVADAGRGAVYAAACTAAAGRVECLAARRLDAARLADETDQQPVASCDDISAARLVRVDPVRALARAVPLALATDRLSPSTLRATYVT